MTFTPIRSKTQFSDFIDWFCWDLNLLLSLDFSLTPNVRVYLIAWWNARIRYSHELDFKFCLRLKQKVCSLTDACAFQKSHYRLEFFTEGRNLHACKYSVYAKVVDFSFSNEKSLKWIEMSRCDAHFHKCKILQCIFYSNDLESSNLIWTFNEFCCTIHHITHMECLTKLFFIHSYFPSTPLLISDFSLNQKNFYYK